MRKLKGRRRLADKRERGEVGSNVRKRDGKTKLSIKGKELKKSEIEVRGV